MRSNIPKVRDVRIVSLDFLYALTWESKFEQLASNRLSSDGSPFHPSNPIKLAKDIHNKIVANTMERTCTKQKYRGTFQVSRVVPDPVHLRRVIRRAAKLPGSTALRRGWSGRCRQRWSST